LHARTLQLKLRDSGFNTITRAHTLAAPTQIDKDIFEQIRALFRANWKVGTTIRLLGVQTSSFESGEGQLSLLDSDQHNKWKQALSTADKLRDRYGEGAVGLASGMKSGFRERTHENPTGLPGKKS
jgi:DNA polymerase-4